MTFDEAIAHVRGNGSEPESETRVVGGVVVREFHIPAGQLLLSHKHPYDHLSLLISGEATLRDGAETKELKGPRMVEIKAGIEHALFAKTDCVWDCLHSLFLSEQSGDPELMKGIK